MASHVVETVMQLTPPRYVTAGAVAVLGAGLIAVTPVAAPDVEQRAVGLTAAGDILDLASPLSAVVSGLGGVDGSPLDSVTDALTSGGGSFSGALAGELPSLGDLSDAGAAENTWIDILVAGAVILYQIVGVWAFNLYDWFIQDPLNWLLSLFGLEPLPFAMVSVAMKKYPLVAK